MAGSPLNKKVTRVARTGGSRRRNFNSTSYGYYALLTAIVLLGSSLVAFSRHERLDANNPGTTPPLAPTPDRPGDQWFEAYGVYICDKFVPNFNDETDSTGITTKNDGVIHIHPFEKKFAGRNAKVELFAEAVEMKIEQDHIQVPGDAKVYKTGTEKCGDKDAELVVKEWTNAKDDTTGKIVKGNPKNLLLKNNAAVTFAFVPKGETNIQLPPSAATLDKVAEAEKAAAAAQTDTGATPDAATTPSSDTTGTTGTTAPTQGK